MCTQAIVPFNETIPLDVKGLQAGSYTVNMKVINANSLVLKSVTITVTDKAVLPIANFSINITQGYAPFSVQFTDLSHNFTSRKWDFGDGTTSTEQNPTHTYSVEGTYKVKLVVGNTLGNSLKTCTINVEEHHSSGGNGGGSAGSSPEPQSNVEVKELSQTFIASEKSVKFDFPRNATPIVYVSFDSKKTTGKITATVEMLENKSTLTSYTPTDKVYKYLNIWVGNGGFGDSDNIANAIISFKVEKSWVQDMKIDKLLIILNKYSGKKWNSLPTNLSGEDDTYLYFTAKTPGFSPFAISGKTKTTQTKTQPLAGYKTQPTVNDTQNKIVNTTSNVEQITKQKSNTSTSGKESTKTSGFEIAYGIFCLLSVFLYKRR
jgi:PGF-pre-PGF domain-containing protein